MKTVFIAAVSCALIYTTQLKAQCFDPDDFKDYEPSLKSKVLCETYDENRGVTKETRQRYGNNFCVSTFVFTFNHESQLHLRVHSIDQEHERLILVGDYVGSFLSNQRNRKHVLAKYTKEDSNLSIEFDGSNGCIMFLDSESFKNFTSDSDIVQICPTN